MTLFARELKGFAGMNSSRKSTCSFAFTRLVLKKEAVSTLGNARGIKKMTARAIPQNTKRREPALIASSFAS